MQLIHYHSYINVALYKYKYMYEMRDDRHIYVPCQYISCSCCYCCFFSSFLLFFMLCLPYIVSLWGGGKRYHPSPPPPSWPAEMSGRSQRKRDNQRWRFSLYKCVSLFLCQQRVRCNRVTFGDNRMFSHPGPVAQPLTGPIIGVSVREVIPYVYTCIWAYVPVLESMGILCTSSHQRCSPPVMYAYVCVW